MNLQVLLNNSSRVYRTFITKKIFRDPGCKMKETVEKQSLRLTVAGCVQGVGFRPYIYRLATELGLTGWVRNDSEGVVIHCNHAGGGYPASSCSSCVLSGGKQGGRPGAGSCFCCMYLQEALGGAETTYWRQWPLLAGVAQKRRYSPPRTSF